MYALDYSRRVRFVPMAEHRQAESTDRRVRRSRRAIRDAFVSLVLEVGYGAVTVDAIVQRADIARATFYAHYADIDELLTTLVADLASGLSERLEPVALTRPILTGAALQGLCDHADQNRELYRVMLSGAADGRARATYEGAIALGSERVFTRLVDANGAVPRLRVALVARAFTGAYLALLDWWLKDEPELTSTEVARMALELLLNGFAWALGLESGVIFDENMAGSPTALGSPD